MPNPTTREPESYLESPATQVFKEKVIEAELDEIELRRLAASLLNVDALADMVKRCQISEEIPTFATKELLQRFTRDKIATILEEWRKAGRIDADRDDESRLLAELIRNDIRKSLVGLAFSGGGMRSASFNLGILQALQTNGVLRHIDYLSTVSGGGYVGSHFSSTLLDPSVNLDQGKSPWDTGKDKKPSKQVVDLIDQSGKCLNRPVFLANRHLIGLFWNNIVFISGLICLCASVAFVWRSLDSQTLHTFLTWASKGWLVDANRPFLPAAIVFTAWLIAWAVLFWYWVGMNIGKMSRLLFEAGAFALLAGLLIVGLTGEPNWLIVEVCIVLAIVCFIVFAVSRWRKGRILTYRATGWILVGAGLCLLVGVTIWFAHPNPNMGNNFDLQQNKKVVSAEQDLFIPAFLILLAVCLLPFLQPKGLLRSGEHRATALHSTVFRVASFAMLVGIPLAITFFFARHNLSGHATNFDRQLVFSDVRNWPKLVTKTKEEQKKKSNTPLTVLFNHERLLDVFDAKDKRYAVLLKKIRVNQNGKRISLKEWRQVINTRDKIAHELSTALATLDFGEFSKDIEKIKRLNSTEREQFEKLTNQVEPLNDGQKRAYNRLILRANYPDIFWPCTMVRRTATIEEDQAVRLTIVVVSFVVFCAGILLLNLNATSPHWFYYEQLRKGYIDANSPKGSTIPLCELENTKKGGPYHILSVTANLTDKRGGQISYLPTFIMSKCFCGSHFSDLGYIETSEYWGGQIDLATAMAISGAAVSPLRVQNPFVKVLMTLMNLRLGQWFPSPRYDAAERRGSVSRICSFLRRSPTLFGLFIDRLVGWWYADLHRRKFVFLSDGGHSENLGVEQLLNRRCSVIIASDAAQDGGHEFEDFAKLYRRARLHGTRFFAIDSEEEYMTLEDLKINKKGNCREHYVFARIQYPDCERFGILVFIKPSFVGVEEIDLKQHRQKHTLFPHDPTSDIIYDAHQVESYRQLGEFIGNKLCQIVQNYLCDDSRDMDAFLKQLKEMSHKRSGKQSADRPHASAPANVKTTQNVHMRR